MPRPQPSDSPAERANGLDRLATELAREMPRRRAVRVIAGAVAAAAVPAWLTRPSHAEAARPLKHTCDTDVSTRGWKYCTQASEYCFPTCCPNERTCSVGPPGGVYGCPTVVSCCDPCNPAGSQPTADGGCAPGPVAASCCPSGQSRCVDRCCTPEEVCCASAGAVAAGRGNCCRPDGCCGSKCCRPDEECEFDPTTSEPICIPVCTWYSGARKHTRRYNRATECCTPYGVEPKHPIRYIGRCPNRVPHPGFRSAPNGCGPKGGPRISNTFGRANFKPACDAHDTCYDTCRANKGACDAQFLVNMRSACARANRGRPGRRARCFAEARARYDAVLLLGHSAYDDAQSEACDCCR